MADHDLCLISIYHFLAYYNEARILDPVTFETVKVLPNMPGAVNDCKSLVYSEKNAQILDLFEQLWLVALIPWKALLCHFPSTRHILILSKFSSVVDRQLGVVLLLTTASPLRPKPPTQLGRSKEW